MEKKQTFFDFAAEVGLTKHLGGLGATEELIELCHIGEGKYVLDVGCGAGVTPCFLAKRYGCRVVGVDISEGMVERSKERAKREGVADGVEFRVADAQDLPFEDDLFDAVITESVTAASAGIGRMGIPGCGCQRGTSDFWWLGGIVGGRWVERNNRENL